MASIYVGTCSWSDHKPFYPEGIRPADRLGYYAQHFSLVELDATFYHPMPARNFALWADRTPPGFVMDVKAYKQLTWHDRKNPPTHEAHDLLRRSVQPLRDAGKLGALAFQFPPWFMVRPDNIAYIRSLREHYDDPVTIEFRHRSWLSDENVADTLSLLRDAGLSLVVADEPVLGSGSVRAVWEVTNPALGVFRLHGRNYKTWYARVRTTGERFDYLYSEEELSSFIPKIGRLADGLDVLHILFNNNRDDYAVRNALQLRMALQPALPRHVVH